MPPRKPLPLIDAARCTGCGRCLPVCAPHVLAFETRDWRKSTVLADAQACTGCSQCAAVCPFDAIQMQRAGRALPAAQDGG